MTKGHFGALLAGMLLAGCPARHTGPETAPSEPTEPVWDPAAECCAQCRAAASQDPRGRDLSLLPCADYRHAQVNGGSAVSARCADWLDAGAKTVAECAARPIE